MNWVLFRIVFELQLAGWMFILYVRGQLFCHFDANRRRHAVNNSLQHFTFRLPNFDIVVKLSIFAVLTINTLRLQSFSISVVLLGHWRGSRSCLHSAVLLNYYRRRCRLITDGDICFQTSASCILVDAVGSHHAGLSSGSGASTSFAIYRDLVWCVLCLQHLQKPQLLMSVRSLSALPTTQDFFRFSYYQQKVLRPMTRFRGNG